MTTIDPYTEPGALEIGASLFEIDLDTPDGPVHVAIDHEDIKAIEQQMTGMVSVVMVCGVPCESRYANAILETARDFYDDQDAGRST